MNTYHRFKTNFYWALSGSTIYEILKTIHNLLLLNILDKAMYGKFGSVMAFIFMVYRFTELGLTTTLYPYFYYFTESRDSFKKLLSSYLFLHLPLQILTIALIPLFNTKYIIYYSKTMFATVALLIITETFRSFFRILLHTSFQSKTAIITELSGMLIYLSGVWGTIILFYPKISLPMLFIPFLIDSLFSLSMLVWLTNKYIYKKLPQLEFTLKPSLLQRIFSTRLTNHALKVSREIFSSNFLTPLFALKFGLQQAGIFFFASSISYSLHAIFRGALGYPGAALLTQVKNQTPNDKKTAFALLCRKLTLFIAPPIILLIINLPLLIRMSKSYNLISYNLTNSIISITSIFLIITLSDFFFILYEQFYIVEKASLRFLGFKLIEFLLFYLLVIKMSPSSIIYTLINIILIKILSFSIIATDAYARWKITPSLKTTKKELLLFLSISILFYLIMSWLIL